MKTLTIKLNKFNELELENNGNKLTINISNSETTIDTEVLEEFTSITTELLSNFRNKEREINFFNSNLISEAFCRLSKDNQIAEIVDLLYNLDIEIEDLIKK